MGNATIKSCCWVLRDGTRCDKPTKFKVRRDEDGQRRRDYWIFCEEHRKEAEKRGDEDV